MLSGGEVSAENKADPHGVSPPLRDVDRCLEGDLKLELARLDRDHLHVSCTAVGVWHFFGGEGFGKRQGQAGGMAYVDAAVAAALVWRQ